MPRLNHISVSRLVLFIFIFKPYWTHAGDAVEKVRVDIAGGQTIFNEGRGDVPACKDCHGEKALGDDASGSPRLANIGQAYFLKQLTEFAENQRSALGAGTTMGEISRALNEQDRRDLAAYLDSLEYVEAPSNLKFLASNGNKVGNPRKGKAIVVKGIKSLVPPCQNCHGFGGRSKNAPAIHQQRYSYLVNQLNSYRDGSRSNDPMVYRTGIMQRIAKNLTDENIADVAAFLSTASGASP